MAQNLYLIGISHQKTSLDLREKFALSASARGFLQAAEKYLERRLPVDEIAIVSTCNRVEIIFTSDFENIVQQVLLIWAKITGEPLQSLEKLVYIRKNKDAVGHFFKVASSLDSMIVGEPQILGQIKQTYCTAVEEATAKVILNKLFHKSFFTAKRVRTETKIAANAVSVSFAAVELAKKIFGNLAESSVLLVGAGEMAELAATHLKEAGLKQIFIANRSVERAKILAARFAGEAIAIRNIPEALKRVDIVITSATAARPLIMPRDVERAFTDRTQPIFFIDIAMPRNVDPYVRGLKNVHLYDLDDLQAVVEQNKESRIQEAEKALGIIEAEINSFMGWLAALDLKPTIIDLLKRTQAIADAELEKTLRRIGPLEPNVQEALETMLHAVVKKINHEPITFIKRVQKKHGTAVRYVDMLRNFFSLDKE